MFEYLGDRLSGAIKNIRGMGKITEENINDAMREIRMALLEEEQQVQQLVMGKVPEEAAGMAVEAAMSIAYN